MSCQNQFIFIALALFGAIAVADEKSPPKRPAFDKSATVPVRPHPCTIDQVAEFTASVEPFEKSETRVQWPIVLDKIHVKIGDIVKKGQLIATADTGDFKRQAEIYSDYVHLSQSSIDVLDNDIRITSARRDRLAQLVQKGIVPLAELDQIDKDLLSQKDSRVQQQRSVQSLSESLANLHKMIANADYRSEIDGIVTAVVADPKSIVGRVMVEMGGMIARIEKPGVYTANAQLMDIQLSGIKEGMTADIMLQDQTHYAGKLRFISPVGIRKSKDDGNNMGFTWQQPQDQQASGPKQYEAKIDFQRSGPILPPGLTAVAKFTLNTAKVKTCLPYNALNASHDDVQVRVFAEGKGWRTEKVTIGRRGTHEVEILTPPLAEDMIIESKLW